MSGPINRRDFVRFASAGISSAGGFTGLSARAEKVHWPIGCFNRPWGSWTYDQALEGMQGAGFKVTGLLGEHAQEPLFSATATDQAMEVLRDRIQKRNLRVEIAWVRTRHDVPVQEAVAAARRQVDLGAKLGVRFLMTMGVDGKENFEHFYKVMAEVAAYAKDKGIRIAMKPHGGCSATATEMLRALERIGHDNFGIWYDAGNILHYTEADPVADVEKVAKHVVGFSAKDCAKRGGDVMLQFGEGRVDFAGVFRKLRAAGFSGPVLVECCRLGSLAEVQANARKNREFLEKVFTTL